MTAKTITNDYLNSIKIGGVEIYIYLTSGIRLIGIVESYDDESIIFISGQLIMRSAISTIQPGK